MWLKIFILSLWGLVIFLLLSLLFNKFSILDKESIVVKPDQIWIQKPTRDPFDTTLFVYKVVEVKDEWVLCLFQNQNKGIVFWDDTLRLSTTIDVFVFRRTLLKK